jgi:hypothetical protein
MGPALLPRGAADCLEWAQHWLQGVLPVALNRPAILLGDVPNCLGWAHQLLLRGAVNFIE